MGIFSRKKRGSTGGGSSARKAQAETLAHLREFVATRDGIEAYIEPATQVTQTTMVLVADTGEWTRRKIPDPATARKVAKELKVPAFDVNLSGYPSRMRAWDAAQHKK